MITNSHRPSRIRVTKQILDWTQIIKVCRTARTQLKKFKHNEFVYTSEFALLSVNVAEERTNTRDLHAI